MPFIDNILKYKSLSIVGLEKNTGKTECLNYILSKLNQRGKKVGITSVGIDGENVDQVTNTHKPEIKVFENSVFVTSEKHYQQKQLVAEICDISEKHSALGRLVTAKSISTGKVIFSGPSNTIWLKEIISQIQKYEVDTTVVDGALSRLSLGSPAITQCMILTTGAAVSANINHLIKKTKYTYTLINLPEYNTCNTNKLLELENGIWAIDSEGDIHDLNIPSVFLIDKHKESLFKYGTTLYVTGVITDNLINFLRIQKNSKQIQVIVKDFTKIFLSHEAFHNFINKGGQIKTLLKTNLIAVCVNPVSPEGYKLNSPEICNLLEQQLGIPVYDIKKMQPQL